MLEKLLPEIIKPFINNFVRPISIKLGSWAKSHFLVTMLLILAVVVVAGLAVKSGGILSFGASSPSSSPPTGTPSAQVDYEPIGGVDLQDYCRSYGYSGSHQKTTCSLDVDLDAACSWQYGITGLKSKLRDKGDLYTGECYLKKKFMGGINDMPGYCKFAFKGSDVVTAAVEGDTWVCRSTIDMKLACTWQYQRSDVEAREVDGNWTCFARGTAPPLAPAHS